MPYDPGLVERIADVLTRIGERGVRQRNVFSGRGFMSGKNAFVIVWNDSLLVKTPPDEYPALLGDPGITPFTPGGGRPMGTWLVVAPDSIADDPELTEWLQRGLRGIRR